MALVQTSEHGEELDLVTTQLAHDFGADFSQETIERFVTESLQSLRRARVPAYLSLLIDSSTRQLLIGAAAGVERDR